MWAMPYAYLGPEGTFSEAALRAVAPDAEPLPCPTIQATLAAVREGAAERAVVPIESSVEGVVTATLDGLASGSDLVIRAELQIPIAFALLAKPGTALGDIKRLGGHPTGARVGPAGLHRRAAPPARRRAGRRRAGRGLRPRAVRPGDRRGRRPRPVHRRHPVRGGGPAGTAARPDRGGPHLAGRVPDRGPPGRAARDPHRVRGARHQPDHDPVAAHRRPARPVLLLHRLRGARRRRPGRRGADGPAPGMPRRALPRQLRPL